MTGLGPYYSAHWSVYVIGETLTGLGGPLATLLVLAYGFDAFHTIDPEDPSPVKVAAQDNAPYIIAIIFIGMCVTLAMVGHHSPLIWWMLLIGRVMPLRRGRLDGRSSGLRSLRLSRQ
jgi:hypothetical protein